MITNFRVMFPPDADMRDFVQVYWESDLALLVGAVHIKDIWPQGTWADAVDADIHVCVERYPDTDILGKEVKVAPKGLLRGNLLGTRSSIPGWTWLIFQLSYDAGEGPEAWAGDWHLVQTDRYAKPVAMRATQEEFDY